MSPAKGFYARRFTGGFVAVNPFDRPAMASAPTGMVDLASKPAGTIDLPPRSAVILKSSAPLAESSR